MAACLPCAAVAAPWPCTAPWADLSLRAEHSRWQEHDDLGRRLVRERGTMPVAAAAIATRCADLDLSLELEQARGRRHYDGQASTGAALQTHSSITHDRIAVVARLPLAPGWAAGLRLGHQRLARDIADAGTVLGYPERFRLWQLAAGVRHTRALGSSRQVSMEAWWGGGPSGSVDVALPFADPARLPLGRSRLWRLDLRLGPRDGDTPAPGWQWHGLASLADQRLAAGAPQALTRDGRLVGGATQPRSALTTLQLGAALTHRF
ncbi:hypothetical protein [Ideonella sp. A 288]|uniref:hypothetical protein n=1 Tax=Ideonella sp. A 288 TaxID=1962181 RepID=UPI000B4B1134|nr:hypothetical protein [Ideonella sp. A 288]